jgi:hypothetical protein
MKQFLLCLAMLLCSIFMYAIVTFLEETSIKQDVTKTEEGNIAGFDVYQR